MTEYTICTDEILGDNYHIAKITCDTYDATIDSDVTVTITVKDVYGDEVTGTPVTITCSRGEFTQVNGSNITPTDSVTANTGAGGLLTLTYEASEWGCISFDCGNVSTQINVDGWRVIKEANDHSYGLRRNKNMAELFLAGYQYSYTLGSSWTNFNTNYASSCRPRYWHYGVTSEATAEFQVDPTTGNIHFRSTGADRPSSTTYYATIRWSIRNEDL